MDEWEGSDGALVGRSPGGKKQPWLEGTTHHSQPLDQAALSGGLWGPALVLGSSLGDKAWAEAASAMALSSLAPGAPLRWGYSSCVGFFRSGGS